MPLRGHISPRNCVLKFNVQRSIFNIQFQTQRWPVINKSRLTLTPLSKSDTNSHCSWPIPLIIHWFAIGKPNISIAVVEPFSVLILKPTGFLFAADTKDLAHARKRIQEYLSTHSVLFDMRDLFMVFWLLVASLCTALHSVENNICVKCRTKYGL